MNASTPPERSVPDVSRGAHSIAQLLGDAFEAASAPDRVRLLEPLLRTLGMRPSASMASGIFAGLRPHAAHEQQVGVEDIQRVSAAEAAALTLHAEQISAEVLDGLLQAVIASPKLAGTAVGAVLVCALVRRVRLHACRAEHH